ncbi:MAG: carbon-nitrogen hydrolase family protein [Clostridia bacterium]|nr:carbon-nitrogen hydrolase family protein [Clostridia bacterium]
MNFKVALLQIAPTGTIEENLKKGLEYCHIAKEKGCDIAVFPEMWSVGYHIDENIDKLKSDAIGVGDVFVASFKNKAKELNMAIGITFLEKGEDLPYNSFAVFDRFGKKVLHYSKVHTCDFGDEIRISQGDDFYTADLDTNDGNVKIGSMICYDREFPESARILMLKGAEIIIVPNACPMGINRLAQLRARAFENMVGIATCNYPVNQPDCNGHSSAFDGVCYLDGIEGERDMCILEAGEEEGIYVADFDMDMIRAYRKSEVHGNCYRRCEKYGVLISDKIEEPFIRGDRR